MTPYYDDGQCVIYHGDAISVMRELPAASVDVLLTDPPYSSGGMFRSDRVKAPDEKYRGWSQNTDGSSRKPTAEYGSFGGDNLDQWAWIRWVTGWSRQARQLVRPGGHGFMFTDWRQLPAATDAAQFGGWTWQGINVWDKGVGRPTKGRFRNHIEYVIWMTNGQGDRTDHYPSALIQVPTVSHGKRQHVTQKPVELLEHLLRVVPGCEGRTVLDPFMGSGSTLVAAKPLGHQVIGIEMDERYCEMAALRISTQADDQGVLAL